MVKILKYIPPKIFWLILPFVVVLILLLVFLVVKFITSSVENSEDYKKSIELYNSCEPCKEVMGANVQFSVASIESSGIFSPESSTLKVKVQNHEKSALIVSKYVRKSNVLVLDRCTFEYEGKAYFIVD